MNSLPHTYKTLQNYRSVAKRIPPNRRRDGLSFGVHETVAYLDPAEREHWLDLAEQNDWRRDDLRDARHAKELESGENSGPRRCPYCGREMEEK
jgi:hypothetical protein